MWWSNRHKLTPESIMPRTLVEHRCDIVHILSCAITTMQCIAQQQLQYNVNYLTASCSRGGRRGSLCNRGSSLPWSGGVGGCCLYTAHNALCRRGWKGRHSLSSSNRGMLEGGDGGSPVVGLLVRHRCSGLHRDTSLAPCLKAGLKRAMDSQSMSATLLKAMQMPLKCDKKQVLSLTNRLSASIVTQIVCVLLFKTCLLPPAGSN